MIRTARQPEPTNFDKKVRQKGIQTLKKLGLDFCLENPDESYEHGKSAKLTSHWTAMNDEIYNAYGGICAYLSIRIHPSAVTIDHFRDKAHYAGLAYEWSNYRLCSYKINIDKGNNESLLDPFTMPLPTFSLFRLTGELIVVDSLDAETKISAVNTIRILKLNSNKNCKARLEKLGDYIEGFTLLTFVQKDSPFLYYEIQAQSIKQQRTPDKDASDILKEAL